MIRKYIGNKLLNKKHYRKQATVFDFVCGEVSEASQVLN
jgi:hypothetical protein